MNSKLRLSQRHGDHREWGKKILCDFRELWSPLSRTSSVRHLDKRFPLQLQSLRVLSVFIFFLMIFCTPLANAQQPWWYALEKGKQSFREGSYGEALMYFEDARRQRGAMYDRMEKDLVDLLSLKEVRRFGSSLEKADKFARERRYDSAAAALDEAYYRYPKSSFNDSAKAVLDALNNLKNYPEAEYWIGEVYRVESELTLALAQYQKALEMKGLFEQPGFETELLYKIAYIYKTSQKYIEMENTYLKILADNKLWASRSALEKVSVKDSEEKAGNIFASVAMTKTLETDGINRFLTLYRYVNTSVENAHRLLGLYYYSTGRYSNAQEQLMYSFLIQNSIIMEEIARYEYDFSFSNMEELAPYFSRYPQITEYIEKSDYYKTMYYLACSLFGNGKTAPAVTMWTFLSANAPAGEWKNRSKAQLQRPRHEPAVEMP